MNESEIRQLKTKILVGSGLFLTHGITFAASLVSFGWFPNAFWFVSVPLLFLILFGVYKGFQSSKTFFDFCFFVASGTIVIYAIAWNLGYHLPI